MTQTGFSAKHVVQESKRANGSASRPRIPVRARAGCGVLVKREALLEQAPFQPPCEPRQPLILLLHPFLARPNDEVARTTFPSHAKRTGPG